MAQPQPEVETKPAPTGFFEPVEGRSYYRWNHEAYLASMSPAERRNWERRRKVYRIQQQVYRRCPWMRGPLLGFVSDFWTSLFEEGPYATMKPRWGMVTFAYLNDGMKPTVWHTWQQVMNRGGGYDGIWTMRAPKSKADAEAMLESYRERRSEAVSEPVAAGHGDSPLA